MPVGKLDILISILNLTFSQDSASGQKVATTATFANCWAEKVNKQSVEGLKTEQESSIDEEVFRIRYIAGITKKMRLYDVELARTYDITGISMEGRKRYLLLTARSHNVNSPV